jgi:hypothetical protein
MKSGILFGALALLSNLTMGIFNIHICAPVIGVVWGVAAGIASVVWTQEIEGNFSAARIGAKAGAMAGVGAFIGLAVGMTIGFSMMGGQETTLELTRTFADEQGFDLPDSADMQELARYSLVVATCCFGLVSIAVMSVTGAIGAYLYDSAQSES